VLFRSSFHAFDLEIELTRCDIPFVKRGGFKFVETIHIKDVLAHLRVLLNPRDAVSWHRLLLLVDGVGPRLSDEIIRWVLAEGDPPTRLESFPRRSVATGLHRLAALLRQVAGHPLPGHQIDELLRYYDPS